MRSIRSINVNNAFERAEPSFGSKLPNCKHHKVHNFAAFTVNHLQFLLAWHGLRAAIFQAVLKTEGLKNQAFLALIHTQVSRGQTII